MSAASEFALTYGYTRVWLIDGSCTDLVIDAYEELREAYARGDRLYEQQGIVGQVETILLDRVTNFSKWSPQALLRRAELDAETQDDDKEPWQR